MERLSDSIGQGNVFWQYDFKITITNRFHTLSNKNEGVEWNQFYSDDTRDAAIMLILSSITATPAARLVALEMIRAKYEW